MMALYAASNIAQEAENQGKTVVDAFPQSEMAACYGLLADKMMEVCQDVRLRQSV